MHNQADRQCPIPCGSCCDYWMDVEQLCTSRKQGLIGGECPYASEWGRVLSRKNRPDECLYYLCEITIAVIDHVITKIEAQELQLLACQCLSLEHWHT